MAAALSTVQAFTPALASERTVTLSVDNMTCATCPYIVRRMLMRVAGVEQVQMSLDDMSTIVPYGDGKTDVAEPKQSAASVGFP